MLIYVAPTKDNAQWTVATIAKTPPIDHRDVTSVIGAPLRQNCPPGLDNQANAQENRQSQVVDVFSTVGVFPSTSRQRNASSGGDLMHGHEDSDGSQSSGEKNRLYKTEMCRTWTQKHTCNYGEKCQYAHGEHELRQIPRHPKYKTDLCRTFTARSICPYGPRCHFIHGPQEARRLGLDYAQLVLKDEQLQIQERRDMHGGHGPQREAHGMMHPHQGVIGQPQQMYPLLFNTREQSLTIDNRTHMYAPHNHAAMFHAQARSSIGTSSGNGDSPLPSLGSGSASPNSLNSHSPGLQVTTDDEQQSMHRNGAKSTGDAHFSVWHWQPRHTLHTTPTKTQDNMEQLCHRVDDLVLRACAAQNEKPSMERLPIFAQLSSIGVDF